MTPLSPAHAIAHTAPTTRTELLDVLALFPNCTTCGAEMSLLERIEADPYHAFRLRHVGPCAPSLA